MLYFILYCIHNFIFNLIFMSLQKVNIDIGTNILKQKCFARKTNFFNTHSNFRPAIRYYRSRRIRSTYSRGCRSFFLMLFQKIACGRGFAGRGYARKVNPKKDNQRRTTNQFHTTGVGGRRPRRETKKKPRNPFLTCS